MNGKLGDWQRQKFGAFFLKIIFVNIPRSTDYSHSNNLLKKKKKIFLAKFIFNTLSNDNTTCKMTGLSIDSLHESQHVEKKGFN